MKIINIVTIFFLGKCTSLNLSNGVVSYTTSAENGRYLANTVASFSCDSGYYHNGAISATCEASGNWNEQIPTCEGFLSLIL